jgi:hypothetical protein
MRQHLPVRFHPELPEGGDTIVGGRAATHLEGSASASPLHARNGDPTYPDLRQAASALDYESERPSSKT